MELTNKNIKEIKEKSKNCALCGKPTFFDGSPIQLVSFTESGKVVSPYETEYSSQSMIIPTCPYHMVMCAEGVYAMTTENQVIKPTFIKEMEQMDDLGLKRMEKIIKRAEKSDKNKAILDGLKIIKQARKFVIDMEKGEKEVKNNGKRRKDVSYSNKRD